MLKILKEFLINWFKYIKGSVNYEVASVNSCVYGKTQDGTTTNHTFKLNLLNILNQLSPFT